MTPTTINFRQAVHQVLIDMAIDCTFPMDLNELCIATVFEKANETLKEKANVDGNRYFISLKLMIDGFEKTSNTVVLANSEVEAKRIALEGECHNEPEFINEDSCEDSGDIYSIRSVKEISEVDYQILKQYL